MGRGRGGELLMQLPREAYFKWQESAQPKEDFKQKKIGFLHPTISKLLRQIRGN
jgi:hypothetical protein